MSNGFAARLDAFGLRLNRLIERAGAFLMAVLDLIGRAFFVYPTYYRIGMTMSGKSLHANIFGMTMFVPFASVPVSSALIVPFVAGFS